MEGAIDSGTVSSTPESSPTPSTPSVSAVSSSERPRSMSAAMAGDTDTPDPGVPVQSEPTAPAPTAPVAPEQTPPVTEAQNRGPIPYDRHESILKNAREKAAQEAEARFQQQYGEAFTVLAEFQKDPGSAIANIIAEGMANPDLAPIVAQAAARALAGRRGQQQPQQAEEPEPQADLQLPDGTPLMSAQRLAEWRAWNDRRLMAQFDQKLAPIQQREQKIAAKEKHDAAFADAKGRMKTVLERYQSRPHYAEHKDAIREKTVALMNEGVDAVTAIGAAYAEILETVVLPARASAEKQALVQQAVEKSKGSTAPPGAVMPSSQGRPRSMAEALKQQGVSSL
jgi:hypothetical protein